MTPEALQAIKDSQVIVGYTSYVKRLGALVDGKEVISSEMTPEVSRGEQAIAAALSGKRVAVVSSGDPGIYGMAGLVMELMHRQGADIQVTVVPGVTALSTAAACLGAPLMHDFAAISLSDLLTPGRSSGSGWRPPPPQISWWPSITPPAGAEGRGYGSAGTSSCGTAAQIPRWASCVTPCGKGKR